MMVITFHLKEFLNGKKERDLVGSRAPKGAVLFLSLSLSSDTTTNSSEGDSDENGVQERRKEKERESLFSFGTHQLSMIG